MRKIFLVVLGLFFIRVAQAQKSPFFNLLDSNSVLGNYILEGPDAPDVQIGIQGNNIKIDISNSQISNNFNESYNAIDTTIQNSNKSFLFQGYIVYQAINATINPLDNFFDVSKMRVVAQSDLQDNADTLINIYLDTLLNNCIGANMVNGNNQGIQHSYLVNKDAFSGSPFQSGNTYCYYVFAYAYNGNKIGKDCNLPWAFLMSFKSANGGGQQASCITFNPTSINNYSHELSFDFYPNPTKENIRMKFEKQEEFINIQITTVAGQKLLEKTYFNTNDINLKLVEFDSGIFFAKITTNDGQKTIKFTKQ